MALEQIGHDTLGLHHRTADALVPVHALEEKSLETDIMRLHRRRESDDRFGTVADVGDGLGRGSGKALAAFADDVADHDVDHAPDGFVDDPRRLEARIELGHLGKDRPRQRHIVQVFNGKETGAQAVIVPQYLSVSVAAGGTLTAPAWDGSQGGILVFQSAGAITVSGTVTMAGKGFRGAGRANVCFPSSPSCTVNHGRTGESEAGPSAFSTLNANAEPVNNGGGGAGGSRGQDCAGMIFSL